MKHRLGKKIVTAALAAAVAVTALPISGLDGLFGKNEVQAASGTQDTRVISEDTTLENETIHAKDGQSAIKIKEGAHVTLTIKGTVSLTGGDAYYSKMGALAQLGNGAGETTVGYEVFSSHGAGAGIEVPENSSLTIKGDGTLICRGGKAADGVIKNHYPKGLRNK